MKNYEVILFGRDDTRLYINASRYVVEEGEGEWTLLYIEDSEVARVRTRLIMAIIVGTDITA